MQTPRKPSSIQMAVDYVGLVAALGIVGFLGFVTFFGLASWAGLAEDNVPVIFLLTVVLVASVAPLFWRQMPHRN